MQPAYHRHHGPPLPDLDDGVYHGLAPETEKSDADDFSALIAATVDGCAPCQHHWIDTISERPLRTCHMLALTYHLNTVMALYDVGLAPPPDCGDLPALVVDVWAAVEQDDLPAALDHADRADPLDRLRAVSHAVTFWGHAVGIRN